MAARDCSKFQSPLPHPGEHLREDYLPDYGLAAGSLAKAMGSRDRTRIETLNNPLDGETSSYYLCGEINEVAGPCCSAAARPYRAGCELARTQVNRTGSIRRRSAQGCSRGRTSRGSQGPWGGEWCRTAAR